MARKHWAYRAIDWVEDRHGVIGYLIACVAILVMGLLAVVAYEGVTNVWEGAEENAGWLQTVLVLGGFGLVMYLVGYYRRD